MPFVPPAGTALDNAPTIFTKTPQFSAGIATLPPGITTPSVPLTTVAIANSTTVDVAVYVTAGSGCTISAISVGGVATGLAVASGASATVYLPAGVTIAMTYSGGTVTWVWMAV